MFRLALIFLIPVVLTACYNPYTDHQALILNIPDSTQQILESHTAAALDQEVILPAQKQYLQSAGYINQKHVRLKLRLKGDWTDHLKTDKPSLRIKIADTVTFRGFRHFSIQHPKMRMYMDEWLMHRWMRMEDVLTTRYEFIPVTINGKQKGIYAIEEHFAKELPDSMGRAPGPILKIAEDGFWEVTRIERKTGESYQHDLPIYDACVIKPFDQQYLDSTGLMPQFEKGQSLLHQFKYNLRPVDSLVKLEPLAKMYALMDIGRVNHGVDMHNQRWYYDAKANRLETIAYDLYDSDPSGSEKRGILYGFKGNKKLPILTRRNIIPYAPFNSQAFNELYYKYLQKFTEPAYLDSIFAVLKPEVEKTIQVLQYDDVWYDFDVAKYYHNARLIKKALKKYASNESRFTPRFVFRKMDGEWNDHGLGVLEHTSVNAYFDPSTNQLAVKSYALFEIRIDGWVYEHEGKDTVLQTGLRLLPYVADAPFQTMILDSMPSKLVFRRIGQDSLYCKRVWPWGHPEQLAN